MELYDKPVGGVIYPYHEDEKVLHQYLAHLEQRNEDLGGILNKDDPENIAKLYGVKFKKISDEEYIKLMNK